MRWLAIEVTFLDSRYHGRRDDGRAAQWPPNPHRLFQAIVAAGNLGFRRTGFSEAKLAALRWLERREAPEIVTRAAAPAAPLRLYVPNNDLDKVARAWAKGDKPEKSPSELKTDKDLLPHRLDSGDATVRFLWPITDEGWEEARPHVELLCDEARHLHALGLGVDLVAGQGRILDDAARSALPGEVWAPDADGAGWRVPVAGSLDELLARHGSQTRRVVAGRGRGAERWVAPPTPPEVFREVEYRRRGEPRRRRVYAFTLTGEDGDRRSFDPRGTMEVAAWLRHAAHERAKRLGLDPAFVECFVCGHGEGVEGKARRFSYFPLPTIAPKGRDGRIRRVLVAEPFEGGGASARSLARALEGETLVDRDGVVKADLSPIFDPITDGMCRRYLQRARVWGSATPLVLPGHDDRRTRRAHALVLKSLAQAGVATPVEEIHLQAEPVFPGGAPARSYRTPAYLRDFPRTHAIVTFAEPVFGPLALGAGRHMGLGVMAEVRVGPSLTH